MTLCKFFFFVNYYDFLKNGYNNIKLKVSISQLWLDTNIITQIKICFWTLHLFYNIWYCFIWNILDYDNETVCLSVCLFVQKWIINWRFKCKRKTTILRICHYISIEETNVFYSVFTTVNIHFWFPFLLALYLK